MIDVQIRVPDLAGEVMTAKLAAIGFRRRPEEWNVLEPTRAGPVPKLVFAPPIGARPSNVHVRADHRQGARDMLLRDFLRAHADLRDAWADLKTAAARLIPPNELTGFAQIKDPARRVLMYGADAWADRQRWAPPALAVWE